MAESCFENIITLSGTCSNDVSVSGITINDLDIYVDELNAIVTKDYIDGADLFTKKRDFAIKQITNLVYSHFADQYKANSILDSMRVGFEQDNYQYNSPTANLVGVELELCNDSSHVDVQISELSLFIDFTGNVDVYVYDLIQNKLIDTITIACTAGQISRIILNDKIYSSYRKNLHLFFGYDASAIGNYVTYVRDYNLFGAGCTNCSSHGQKISRYMYASGASAPLGGQMIYNNLTRNTDTYGMSLQYSIACNHREWMCTYAISLAIPILYKTAELIADVALMNAKQINRTTIIDSEKWKMRKDDYKANFETYFDGVLKNIKLPSDAKCYECRLPYRHRIVLP